MRVLLSGATGLIGSALIPLLRSAGHQPIPLSRTKKAGGLTWDLETETIDSLDGIDAVIHLAGESIAGRWTEERKRRIVESRVRGTRLIARAAVEAGASVLLSASATGYYGDRGDAELDADAGAGEGFLAEVCVQWEESAQVARDGGLRVAHPRIGVVLAKEGGALAKMKTPFKMGVGGKIGDGRQYMPWVHLDDVVRMLAFALDDERVSGPFNACTGAVTNGELTRALGEALGRPTVLPLPRFAARLAMGREMADEMLLTSTRAVPAKLREWGFEAKHPDLLQALRDILV